MKTKINRIKMNLQIRTRRTPHRALKVLLLPSQLKMNKRCYLSLS